MAPLRKRMTEHMRLKGYSPRTIKSYVNMVALYARHVGKSPELAGCEDARSFMTHLVSRGCSASHLSQAYAAERESDAQIEIWGTHSKYCCEKMADLTFLQSLALHLPTQ